MSFERMPCHVFASIGYTDETTSNAADTAFIAVGRRIAPEVYRTRPTRSRRRPKPLGPYDTPATQQARERRDAIRGIVRALREATNPELTDEDITVWGGFYNDDKMPSHMWFEWQDNLYDTMPAEKLCVCSVANSDGRRRPGWENVAFPREGIASAPAKMTQWQLSNILNPGIRDYARDRS